MNAEAKLAPQWAMPNPNAGFLAGIYPERIYKCDIRDNSMNGMQVRLEGENCWLPAVYFTVARLSEDPTRTSNETADDIAVWHGHWNADPISSMSQEIYQLREMLAAAQAEIDLCKQQMDASAKIFDSTSTQ